MRREHELIAGRFGESNKQPKEGLLPLWVQVQLRLIDNDDRVTHVERKNRKEIN